VSALVLHKGGAGTCLEPGCNLRGRFEIEIAGYRLINHSRFLSCRTPEVLCKKHADQWRERWNGLLASEDDLLLEQISRLTAPVPTGTEAIFYLRESGYSEEQVRDARLMVKGGVPVEEIAAVLQGRVEVGAVAA